MSVPNCFKSLVSTDSKTKRLIPASTLFFPLEHHKTLHSKQYFSIPGDLRATPVPGKMLLFHKRKRQIFLN